MDSPHNVSVNCLFVGKGGNDLLLTPEMSDQTWTNFFGIPESGFSVRWLLTVGSSLKRSSQRSRLVLDKIGRARSAHLLPIACG
jgi:hypothetical protein